MGKPERNRVLIGRIATIVIGIAILGTGLHSHFGSVWTSSYRSVTTGRYIRFWDRACDIAKVMDVPCPSISLEHYFVGMIIISFLASSLLLITSFWVDLRNSPYKLLDMGYHFIAAALLMVVAVLYFISAEQINNIYRDGTARKLWRGEKLAAASLTVVQSVLFGIVAILIGRQE